MLGYLARYCSQAERCLFDVRKKMQTADLSGDAEKRIIDTLLQEKFIDEKRFARSFVRDKFQYNHWGRIKIAYELKLKCLSSEVCGEALDSIDEDEYVAALSEMLKIKKRTVKSHSSQDMYQKLFRFAASRGFETPLIIHSLKKILNNIDND